MMITTDLEAPTPLRDDAPDDQWPHVMLTGTAAHYATEASDLVALLIPDYPDAQDDLDAAAILAEGSIDLANKVQRAMFDAGVLIDAIDLNDEALLTLLMSSKRLRIPLNDDGRVLHYEGEGTRVPLVVARAAYLDDDGTLAPLPEGNVIVIESDSEIGLLTSLSEAGFIGYMVADHASV